MGSRAVDFSFPSRSKVSKMENINLNDKWEANNPQKLEKLSEVESPMETDYGKTDKEIEEDFHLDSASLQGGPSATSVILSSPIREAENNAGNLPGPTALTVGAEKIKSPRQKSKRFSNSQQRRYKWYIKRGHTVEEARTLALKPTERLDSSGQVLNKRQRSTDTVSPNSGANEPQQKRTRGRASAGPSTPKPTFGVTYKEMVVATKVVIVPIGYPKVRLTTEQLTALRNMLLDRIADPELVHVRPKFRNCTFTSGHMSLACADIGTASWVKDVIPDVTPWEGAQLQAMDAVELPKYPLFIGYFQDSACNSDERILRLLQNQNDDLSTQGWRVLRRNVIGKTVELLVELDDHSASLIEAQKFLPNYMFGKARMRQVNRDRTSTDNGNSAAKPETVRTSNPSGEGSPPPGPSNSVTVRTVPSKPHKGSRLQPPTEHKSGATRTVSRKIRKNSTHQPLVNQPQLQKPPKNVDRSSVTARMQQQEPSDGTLLATPQHSDTAAGTRLPIIGSTVDPIKDGPSTQQ